MLLITRHIKRGTTLSLEKTKKREKKARSKIGGACRAQHEFSHELLRNLPQLHIYEYIDELGANCA